MTTIYFPEHMLDAIKKAVHKAAVDGFHYTISRLHIDPNRTSYNKGVLTIDATDYQLFALGVSAGYYLGQEPVLKIGAEIDHPKHGHGVIVQFVQGMYWRVQFDSNYVGDFLPDTLKIHLV